MTTSTPFTIIVDQALRHYRRTRHQPNVVHYAFSYLGSTPVIKKKIVDAYLLTRTQIMQRKQMNSAMAFKELFSQNLRTHLGVSHQLKRTTQSFKPGRINHMQYLAGSLILLFVPMLIICGVLFTHHHISFFVFGPVLLCGSLASMLAFDFLADSIKKAQKNREQRIVNRVLSHRKHVACL